MQRVKKRQNPADAPAANKLKLNTGFYGPIGHLVYSLELNWETNRWNNGGQDNTLYLTPRLAYNFTNNFEIGLGVPICVNNTSDHYRLIGMLIYGFRA